MISKVIVHYTFIIVYILPSGHVICVISFYIFLGRKNNIPKEYYFIMLVQS